MMEDPVFSILATFASYTVTLIMRPLGSVLFGIYGDKFGRKKSMIITILGFSVVTFAVGLLPTYALVGVMAPILLIMVRLIQGIFAGGEWGSGAVLTIESIPKHKRGLLSCFLQSGFSFGFLLAAKSFQIITVVFPGDLFEEFGWRILFFTGIIPGFVALFVRISMDESPLGDGIFCEFAVFEPQELQGIPFAPGRIVWKREDAPETFHRPAKEPVHAARRGVEYLVGEAITNLYVGMGRDKRGEKLSAMRFIQGYAVDRLLELAETIEPEQNVIRDIFANERRFEARHPSIARELPQWTQGYERNRESALAILSFLERHFEVNTAMANAVSELCS